MMCWQRGLRTLDSLPLSISSLLCSGSRVSGRIVAAPPREPAPLVDPLGRGGQPLRHGGGCPRGGPGCPRARNDLTGCLVGGAPLREPCRPPGGWVVVPSP